MFLPLRKILLVDDDKVTNLMHRRVIEKNRLADEIAVATDGIAALEYLATLAEGEDRPPDLILLDINMPRMNGFEFLETYERLPISRLQRPIIVVLSTSLLQSDQDRALSSPLVHSFAEKPVTASSVVDIVQEFGAREACHKSASTG